MIKLIQILIVCGLFVVMGGTASAGGCDMNKILYAIASDDIYPDKALQQVSRLYKTYKEYPELSDPFEYSLDWENEQKKTFYDSLFNLSKQGNGQASYISGILKLSESKYEEATKYFKLSQTQKYLKGYDLVIPCWENNINRSTNADGSWFGGIGFKGLDEATKWVKLAANQGNTTAQKNLKKLEDTIEKIRKKERLVKEEKEKALLMAKQGDAQAQYTLGEMYTKGEVVRQDYKEALKWYTKAAEQGDKYSQYRLGTIYASPDAERYKYVPLEDYKEALKWYTKAAEQGHLGAKQGKDYVSLKILEKEKAPLMAKQGDAQAQYTLGKMYTKGDVVRQDYKEALKWYTKSAEQGYLEAQDFLGSLYSNGELDGIKVPQDYKEAVKWFRLVAEQGDRHAQYRLGTIYSDGLREGQDGLRVGQDYKEALKWYTKSAEQGHLGAEQSKDYVSQFILDEEEKEAARKAKFRKIMKEADKYRDVVSKSKECEETEVASKCITMNSCIVASIIEKIKHDDRGKKFKKTVTGGLLLKGDYEKAIEELTKSTEKDKSFKDGIAGIAMGCHFVIEAIKIVNP